MNGNAFIYKLFEFYLLTFFPFVNLPKAIHHGLDILYRLGLTTEIHLCIISVGACHIIQNRNCCGHESERKKADHQCKEGLAILRCPLITLLYLILNFPSLGEFPTHITNLPLIFGQFFLFPFCCHIINIQGLYSSMSSNG